MASADACALTLTRAATVPLGSAAVGEWREEALAVCDGVPEHGYRSVCDMLFAAMPYGARALCAANVAEPSVRFLCAPQGTQLDLARRAVAGVMNAPVAAKADAGAAQHPDTPPRTPLRMLVYSTSSVDQNFFRSTVSCLAAAEGCSAIPHFALGQLQGASLDMAADILSACLPGPGDAGLFVAAEQWPLPYPRVWDGCVLADGATALWFERGGRRGLQFMGSLQRSFAPFIGTRESPRATLPYLCMPELAQAAVQTVKALLRAQGVRADELDGWLGCAIDRRLDETMRGRVAPEIRQVLVPPIGAGYQAAAAAPALLAELLDRVADRQACHADLWLSWDASFGGTVTASLWRVCDEGFDS